MKINFISLLLILTILISFSVKAQPKTSSDGVYTLNFTNLDSTITKEFCQKLIDTFFEVYPKLADRFNKNTAKTVTFIVDPNFDGVAATGNDTTIFNARWFHKYPGDIDVVTHEVMHIVQAYPHNSGPWWVTEGIADYARYKFGVDNKGGNWSLPELKPEHNYDNSYRITARFFAWLEKNVNNEMITKLDIIMRNKEYNSDVWKKLAGKSIEELWNDYKQNPAL